LAHEPWEKDERTAGVWSQQGPKVGKRSYYDGGLTEHGGISHDFHSHFMGILPSQTWVYLRLTDFGCPKMWDLAMNGKHEVLKHLFFFGGGYRVFSEKPI